MSMDFSSGTNLKPLSKKKTKWSLHISKMMLVPKDQCNFFYGLITHLHDGNSEFLQGSISTLTGLEIQPFQKLSSLAQWLCVNL